MTDAGPQCSCSRCCSPGGSRLEPERCARFRRWEELARVDEMAEEGRYAALLEAARRGEHFPQERARELQIDVERTCPTLNFFSEGGGGRAMLTDMLSAWVVFDAQAEAKAKPDEDGRSKAVGYVQGMNFIAAVLLWHSGRDEASFWVFVAMMHTYTLRCMFQAPDMYGLKMRSFTMTQLLHQQMPDLSDHLAEYLRNSLSLLLTEWMLTIFANSVPLGPLAELWDRFFEEGYFAVYRLILARLRCLRPWLLAETDFVMLVRLVKEVHVEFSLSGGEPVAYIGPSKPDLAPERRGRRNLLRRVFSLGSRERHAPPPLSATAGRDIELTGPPASFQCLDFGEDEEGPQAQGVPPGAWTCMACNGSENCRSWDTIITVLLRAESVPASVIANFEEIFSLSDRQSREIEAGSPRGGGAPLPGAADGAPDPLPAQEADAADADAIAPAVSGAVVIAATGPAAEMDDAPMPGSGTGAVADAPAPIAAGDVAGAATPGAVEADAARALAAAAPPAPPTPRCPSPRSAEAAGSPRGPWGRRSLREDRAAAGRGAERQRRKAGSLAEKQGSPGGGPAAATPTDAPPTDLEVENARLWRENAELTSRLARAERELAEARRQISELRKERFRLPTPGAGLP